MPSLHVQENESKALKSLPAAEAQHAVTFLLENVKTSDGGRYRCQYGFYNGSQLQESEFSHILEITVKDLFITSSPSDPPKYNSKGAVWILPTALCVSGVLLLVLILFAVVGTIRYLKRRRKKKRELESCWAETSYPTTETSFDNSMFTVSEVALKRSSKRKLESAVISIYASDWRDNLTYWASFCGPDRFFA
ncbi:protein HIDE1 [Candoia aspera]|uniref:protein HIDE1 n=1 Tax=Candoia aspera TaxID=51853 RepID=UPI002FD842FF